MQNRKRQGKSTIRGRTRAKGEAFWEKVLLEREEQDLTLNEAAKRYGVSSSRLSHWATRLGFRDKKKRAPRGPSTRTMEFIEVKMPGANQRGRCIEARLPNGLAVSIPETVSSKKMVEVLMGLMQSPVASS